MIQQKQIFWKKSKEGKEFFFHIDIEKWWSHPGVTIGHPLME